MTDPLLLLLLALAVAGGGGAYLVAGWRRRGARRGWAIVAWIALPVIAVVIPATGCLTLLGDAAMRDGACMAYGGLMMMLPMLYWPTWLIGVAIGLGADRMLRR